jgi:branched-chain amino acid aminotransferase
MVRGDDVYTGPDNVLEGITRRTVMELCAELDLNAREQYFTAADMHDADEVFISSTAGGVMPITQVDGTILGNGAPGPVTTRLINTYWQKKAAGWHATQVDYGDG